MAVPLEQAKLIFQVLSGVFLSVLFLVIFLVKPSSNINLGPLRGHVCEQHPDGLADHILAGRALLWTAGHTVSSVSLSPLILKILSLAVHVGCLALQGPTLPPGMRQRVGWRLGQASLLDD